MKESDYSELYLDAKLAVNNVYKLCLTGHFEDAIKAAGAASDLCMQMRELIELKYLQKQELIITTFTTEDRVAAEIIQGSDAWHQLRLGCVTGSRVADVLAKIKSGEAASRADYRTDLVLERLTGKPTDFFTNTAMQWGTEQEPFARIKYEETFDLFVKEVPFVKHPAIEWFGISPDGLVGDEGLLEVKSPNSKTHIKYLNDGKPPAKYIPQMMAQMACTGRKWCDFVSFDPRLPSGLDLFVVRLERDEEYIKAMEAEVMQFLNEVEQELTLLKQKIGVKQRNAQQLQATRHF